MWLTGEHDPDAVLVLRPTDGGHDATLYLRPRSPRDTDEFFRDRNHGELWIGRRHTLAEKADRAAAADRAPDDLAAALDDAAPGRTRVLRGYDAAVDAAVRLRRHRRAGATGAGHGPLRAAAGQGRLGDRAAAGRDRRDRPRLRGRRPGPARRPARQRALIEGVFSLRARHDGNDVGYGSIVGTGAHAAILHWTRNDGRTRPGDLLLIDMGVENRNLYTADVTRTLPVTGTFTPLQRQVYDLVYALPAGRHRRHQGRA